MGCSRRYQAVFGHKERTLAGTEPSKEQLSALRALLRSDLVPYVDFSIWAPHQVFTGRKLRLQGLKFSTNGTLVPLDVAGPGDFQVWLLC